MYESRQSGYDINYVDILSAEANAISLSLLASCVQPRVLIYLFTHFDLMEVAFNCSEEGTDGLCWRDLPEVDRKGKRKDRDPSCNLWVLKRHSLV